MGTLVNQVVTKTPSDAAQSVVFTAEQELTRLFLQKKEIMQRICGIKKMLSGMVGIFGDSILTEELRSSFGYADERPGRGFTHACRQILMEAQTPLRPTDASVELRQRFPELAQRHKDLNASVTTIFGRLVRYGEARTFLDDHGTKVWEWVTAHMAN